MPPGYTFSDVEDLPDPVLWSAGIAHPIAEPTIAPAITSVGKCAPASILRKSTALATISAPPQT